MLTFGNLFGWGYGVFSCTAGEHLNKIIKTTEMTGTNFDANRMKEIIRLMRMKQFVFTDSVLKKKKEVVCSACGQTGHNRKNKSCPLHESHPPIVFEDSEPEND